MFGSTSANGTRGISLLLPMGTPRANTWKRNGELPVCPRFAHTYSMDSAGKAVTVDSVNLTYDALGRMVEQNRSGTYTQIVYSPGGAKLALMNGQTLQKGFVPLPGGGQAVYNSSGLLYYGHPDHLGSIKFGSTPSRTMYFDLAYAPFGEIYATSGTTDPAFTGQRQDTVAGLFDFPARQYSNQGRWPVPDPSGIASVQLSDPQTLNRYAYVRNNPLVMIDPQGLTDCPEVDGGQYENGDCIGGGGGGYGDGWGFVSPIFGSGGDLNNGGDPTNGGSNCSSTDSTCGSAQSPDTTNLPLDPNAANLAPLTPGDPNVTSITACDESGCSNQTTVVVNGSDPTTNEGPGFYPCYYWDAACNAQVQRIQQRILCDGPCISNSAQGALGQAGQMSSPVTQPYFVPCFYAASAVAGFGGGAAVGGEALGATAPLAPYLPAAMRWAYLVAQSRPAILLGKAAEKVLDACAGN